MLPLSTIKRLSELPRKRWCGRILILGLLLSTAANAFPQDQPGLPGFVHKQWSVEDGLPVNAISKIVQGPAGYLWLATYEGLVRFDGVRFKVFNASNTPALPANRIIDLFKTDDGSLWMLTAPGDVIAYRGGHFLHFGAAQGMTARALNIYLEPEQQQIWVGTNKGLYRYEAEGFVPFAADLVEEPVHLVYPTRDGAVWAGTSGKGIIRIYDGAAEWFTVEQGLRSNFITTVKEDSQGTFWIGTREGFSTWADGTLAPLPTTDIPEGDDSLTMLEDETGGRWIVTVRALYAEYAGVGGRRRFREIAPNPASLSGRAIEGPQGHFWLATSGQLYRDGLLVDRFDFNISDMIFDREGSLWLATETQGLHRLKASLFETLSEADGLVDQNAYVTLEDRSGTFWFGTEEGLSRFREGQFTTMFSGKGHYNVRALHEDNSGRLWVGRWGEGLCYFEPGAVAGAPCHQVEDPQGPGAQTINAVYEDRAGRLWVGGKHGLYRRDATGWRYVGEAEGLMETTVQRIYEAHDGAIWLGFEGAGLARYHEGTFSALTTQQGLPSDLVRAIYEDENNIFWIGTEGRGLVRLELGANGLADARLTFYTRDDGLFDNTIHTILPDGAGCLWMSTNQGIFWVRHEDLERFARGETSIIQSTGYTEREGLRHREANGGTQPAGFRAHDGRLWFPTQDGIASIDPRQVTIKSNPPVRIEQVVVNRKALPIAGTVELTPEQRSFSVEYTALSFLTPENIYFNYRLDGYDQDWVDGGTQRVANYTKVPPGNYTFRVRAAGSDGTWRRQEATIALVIAPYFYETGWFFALCVLGIGLLLGGAYAFRVHTLKAREQRLEALVEARTNDLLNERERTLNALATAERANQLKSYFLANMSHEIRTPLTSIVGFAQILTEESTGHIEEFARLIERSGHRLMSTLNSVLDIARIESGEMELFVTTLDFRTETQPVIEEMQVIAAGKGLTLHFDDPGREVCVRADPSALSRIVVNLVTNALKFTETGSVMVRVFAQADAGVLEVIDTGIGIAPDFLDELFMAFHQESSGIQRLHEGAGLGLAITRQLVNLMHGRIEVESKKGEGSTFRVFLPCAPVPTSADTPEAVGETQSGSVV